MKKLLTVAVLAMSVTALGKDQPKKAAPDATAPKAIAIPTASQDWKDVDYLFQRELNWHTQLQQLQAQVNAANQQFAKEHEALLRKLAAEYKVDPAKYTLDDATKILQPIAQPEKK